MTPDVPALWPEDEFDAALRALYPEAEADPGALARVRAQVVGRAAAARSRRMPHRRMAGVAAVAAGVAVLAAVAIGGRHPGPGAPAPELPGPAGPGALVEVAQTLNTAADAQGRTPDAPVPAGGYRYIATHELAIGQSTVGTADFIERTGARTEIWVPADRTAAWTYRQTYTGEHTWLVGTAEQARAAGLPPPSRRPTVLHGRCGDWEPQPGQDPCARQGSWQSPTDAFLAALPRDPRRLFARLRTDTAGRGNDPDQEVVVYAADALRSGLLPADVRAALYRALALLPGLTVTKRTTTLDGQTGTALGVDAAGRQVEIVINPATGVFIGERSRLTTRADGLPAGTVIRSASISYGIAATAGQPPVR